MVIHLMFGHLNNRQLNHLAMVYLIESRKRKNTFEIFKLKSYHDRALAIATIGSAERGTLSIGQNIWLASH